MAYIYITMNTTLHLVSKTAFELLEKMPDKTKVPGMAHSLVSFEQVQEGLEFLLEKFFTGEDRQLIHEVFNPEEFIGESPDENPFKSPTPDEFDEFLSKAVHYIDTDKITRIDYLLSELDQDTVLNGYSPKEYNNNGVYPEVWHDDESEGQFFNKTHLKQALYSLTAFFEKAIENENYIVVFSDY